FTEVSSWSSSGRNADGEGDTPDLAVPQEGLARFLNAEAWQVDADGDFCPAGQADRPHGAGLSVPSGLGCSPECLLTGARRECPDRQQERTVRHDRWRGEGREMHFVNVVRLGCLSTWPRAVAEAEDYPSPHVHAKEVHKLLWGQAGERFQSADHPEHIFVEV